MLRSLHHHKRVESFGIVLFKAIGDEVSVLLVEPPCAAVINRRLEKNCLHSLLPKKTFDRRQQLASDLLSLLGCNDLYRDDVTQLLWFDAADDESKDLLSVFEDQSTAFFGANVVK